MNSINAQNFAFVTTNEVKVTASACRGNVTFGLYQDDGAEVAVATNCFDKNTKVAIPAGTRWTVIAEFDKPDMYVVLVDLPEVENAQLRDDAGFLTIFLRKSSYENLTADLSAEKVEVVPVAPKVAKVKAASAPEVEVVNPEASVFAENLAEADAEFDALLTALDEGEAAIQVDLDRDVA